MGILKNFLKKLLENDDKSSSQKNYRRKRYRSSYVNEDWDRDEEYRENMLDDDKEKAAILEEELSEEEGFEGELDDDFDDDFDDEDDDDDDD